ncbi:HAD hydrolase-like protein [Streptomyces gardneri]|uniref:HAD hydrolase-like protein n=1 Tax=Streptomyces gardneri TaxID=66892 RepID=UPI003673F6FE
MPLSGQGVGLFPSCTLGYAKPDPRALLTVAERHGVAPASMIDIGDDWACDVLGGALGAGAVPVCISKDRPTPDTPPTFGQQHVHEAATLADAPAPIRTLNIPEGTTS